MLHSFLCLVLFVSSNCNSDLLVPIPKLLADGAQLSVKYMGLSEVSYFLNEKKMCQSTLNVYAPHVPYANIILC